MQNPELAIPSRATDTKVSQNIVSKGVAKEVGGVNRALLRNERLAHIRHTFFIELNMPRRLRVIHAALLLPDLRRARAIICPSGLKCVLDIKVKINNIVAGTQCQDAAN